MRKSILILFLAMVLLFSCAFAETGESLNSYKISDGKTAYTVTEPGMQLIPIDFEGNDIYDFKIKASNEKSIIYNMNRDGIYIVPMAAGKTKLTISSRTNKKMSLAIDVTVEKDVMENADNGPLTAYLLFEQSYYIPTDTPVLKYFICGGKKPYTNATIIPMIETYQTSGTHHEIKNPKSYGKLQIKIDTSARSIAPQIKVVDSDINVFESSGSGVLIKHELSVQPEWIWYSFPINSGEPLSLPFTVNGGSGSYSIEETYRLVKNGVEAFNKKEKKKIKETENFQYEPTTDGYFALSVKIQDNKTKEIIYYEPIATNLTQDDGIKANIDKAVVKVDEPVTMTVYYTTPPTGEPIFIANGIFNIDGIVTYAGTDYVYTDPTKTINAIEKTIKKIDDLTYEITFVSHYEGSYFIFYYSEAAMATNTLDGYNNIQVIQ